MTQICNGTRAFVKTSPVKDVIGTMTVLDLVILFPTCKFTV